MDRPQPSAPPPLELRRLDAGTVDDFRRLLGAPPEGWCWCVAWEVPTWEGWGERSAEENRGLREELWRRGDFHGYLLYRESEPVGWCRVGPRGAWPKLCEQFGLDPREPVHAFTCFGMRPEQRGQGFARELLDRALADLLSRGVREVEAFPKAQGGRLEDRAVWNGPLSLFEAAGFQEVATVGPRVRMSLRLEDRIRRFR